MRVNCLASLLLTLASVLGGIWLGVGGLTMQPDPPLTPTDEAIWATIEAAPAVMYSPCDPVVEGIVWGDEPDSAISKRLAEIYAADQGGRILPEPDWNQVMQNDQMHQAEVMGYLQAGKVVTALDLYHAAMVFQHGDCPDHYRLAQELAERAMNAGSTQARWLYAAATDRYLMSLNQPQLYGTQARCFPSIGCFLWPVDPSITDEDRAYYNVPPLAQKLAEVEQMSADFSFTSP